MAYQEGDIAEGPGGRQAIFRGGRWVAMPVPKMEASQSGRLALGAPVLMAAEKELEGLEDPDGDGVRRNPYSEHPVAHFFANDVAVGPWKPFRGFARAAAGEDFNRYDRAAQAVESEMLPLKSGANVTPSEAGRQVRATLPEYGDSSAVLEGKSQARKMQLNAIARLGGMPLPYPDVQTWGVNTGRVAEPSRAPAGGGGRPPAPAPVAQRQPLQARPAAPAPRPAAPAPKRSSADEMRARSAIARIPEGAQVVQGGVTYQKRGGQMVPVR